MIILSLATSATFTVWLLTMWWCFRSSTLVLVLLEYGQCTLPFAMGNLYVSFDFWFGRENFVTDMANM